MTTPQVSGVILSYGRPHNIARIAAGMLGQPWMDDVVVWHNPGYAEAPVIDDERVKVVVGVENLYTWGRFLAIGHCRNRIIATVDDDSLPRNWQAIYDSHLENPDVITASIRAPGHMNLDKELRWGTCHEVLLGWGSMFDNALIISTFHKYIEKYGRDELLHRKADRLFSMLINRIHNVIPADFESLPGEILAGLALGGRRDHHPLTLEARQRAFKILEIKR